jgi:hypothetical protein
MSIMDIERYKRLYLNEGHNKMRTEQVMHLLNIAWCHQDNYQDALTEPTPTWNINIQLLEEKLFYRGSSSNVDMWQTL